MCFDSVSTQRSAHSCVAAGGHSVCSRRRAPIVADRRTGPSDSADLALGTHRRGGQSLNVGMGEGAFGRPPEIAGTVNTEPSVAALVSICAVRAGGLAYRTGPTTAMAHAVTDVTELVCDARLPHCHRDHRCIAEPMVVYRPKREELNVNLSPVVGIWVAAIKFAGTHRSGNMTVDCPELGGKPASLIKASVAARSSEGSAPPRAATRLSTTRSMLLTWPY